ncbi:unnamed protein product [Polarella glacialis]|uniref:TNFR-Cys domain-containing protein n=1 Tax=Polarella glacialis TaxID=89957 RepID=A0A813G249_POLGL|nr:unnamed protein product [Polarella glacialis]
MMVGFLAFLAVLMQASSVPSMSSEITSNNNNDDLPLSRDDECHLDADGAACSLSALQRKGQKVEHYGTSMAGCGPCRQHEEKITEEWETCAAKENRCCHACGVWTATEVKLHQHSGGSCPGAIDLGDKVVPIAPCGGVESINANTSADFDSLWHCAAKKTRASQGMALIVNPWLARALVFSKVIFYVAVGCGHLLLFCFILHTLSNWKERSTICTSSSSRWTVVDTLWPVGQGCQKQLATTNKQHCQ